MEVNPEIEFYKGHAAGLSAALQGEDVKMFTDSLGISIVKAEKNGEVKKNSLIFQTIIRKVDKYCKSNKLSFSCTYDFYYETPSLFIF